MNWAMALSRPAIPAPIKRQLRQEAGFGCCLCGYPFIEYHHIIPFAEDARSRPEHMMVLCSRCHDLCTAGAMPESEQRAAKARPKNIIDGALRGQLYVNSRELRVEFAGGVIVDCPGLLKIGDAQVLGARLGHDGRVLISAQIQDTSGTAIATLSDNEWSLAPSGVWDFEVRPQEAVLRSAPRNIAFKVDCRRDRLWLGGLWQWRGKPVAFTPQKAVIDGIPFTAANVIGGPCALALR